MTAWNRHFEALKAYYRERGSLRGLSMQIPQTSNWLARQRGRSADLTPDQRALLEEIPGALEGSTRGVQDLVEALTLWLQDDPSRTAAHLRYSTTRNVAGRTVPIGRRAKHFRERYEQGLLSPEDTEALQRFPGLLTKVPSARLQRFIDGVNLWLKENPSLSVSDLTYSAQQELQGQTVKIGRMASYFRTTHADGRLPPDEIKAIEESVPGWTWEHRAARRREPGSTTS